MDPLADIDLGRLASVFADPGILKVLHGAEFDILQLKRTHPFEFHGLFDTRVAASSLGFRAPGLVAVLDEWLGVKVDKGHQRSDWGRRPLSDGQIEYAAADTRYLVELAERLNEDLHEAGAPHPEEVAAECRRLEALIPDPREPGPDDWCRLKGASSLDMVSCRVLRDLNRYRHSVAEERDRPLFKVIGNDALIALARSQPNSLQALRKSKALSPKLIDRYGANLISIIAAAQKRGGLQRLPAGKVAPEDQLRGESRQIYDALRAWRKRVADQRGTDASLIMTKQMMIEIARLRPTANSIDKLRETRLLEPWRLAAYGGQLVEVLGG